MNSIWNNNINLFKERFPSLSEMFKNEIAKIDLSCNENKNDFPFWKIITAKDGSISAYENNALLHSSYNPKREAEQLVEKSNFENCLGAVFYGVGLGYIPISYATQFPNRTIIIVEPDATHFFASLTFINWEKVFKCENCIIALSCSEQTVIPLIESVNISQCAFFSIQSQIAHAKNYFETLKTLVERNKKKADINTATLEKFSKRWLKNSCKNIYNYAKLDGVTIYENNAKNIPFTIIAAGPSLENMLPYIAEIKKRSIIVCVDTALRALISQNIEPDFIIIGDPQYYAYRHIADIASPSSVLISEIAVYPNVFRFNCRKIVLFSSLYPIGKWFEKHLGAKGDLGAGGSVAASAWNFAYLAGAREIFTIGLDLSFNGKKTHVKGSTFEQEVHIFSKRINTSETQHIPYLFSLNAEIGIDYSDNKVLTDSRMKMFAWWFESRIAKCTDSKTYSLCKESLNIPGIEYRKINYLLDKNIIENEKNNFIKLSEKNNINYLQQESDFYNYLKEFKTSLGELKKLSQNGTYLCNRVINKKNTQQAEINEIINKLSKIDKEILTSNIKDVASLVFPTKRQLDDILKTQKKTNNDFINSINFSKIIYEELLKAISEYEKII